jgi:hypothetical protein
MPVTAVRYNVAKLLILSKPWIRTPAPVLTVTTGAAP